MAQSVTQTIDFTSFATQTLHSSVTTLHSMARKGSLTRLYDAFPTFTVIACVAVLLSLAVLACVVAVTIMDRGMARKRNAYIPSETTFVTETTFNMKGIQ